MPGERVRRPDELRSRLSRGRRAGSRDRPPPANSRSARLVYAGPRRNFRETNATSCSFPSSTHLQALRCSSATSKCSSSVTTSHAAVHETKCGSSHSLNVQTDLRAADLRRRLIEHAQDPDALLRLLEEKEKRTESPFERDVLKRLLVAGYQVIPQWKVGSRRIDLVVEANGWRMAVECESDRYHPLEKLGEGKEFDRPSHAARGANSQRMEQQRFCERHDNLTH
jgi:hypothetical protein